MSQDHIQMAGTKAKGKRPQFFESSETERLMSILMAVAGELSVTRERIDTLERQLEAKGLLSQNDIETFTPSREQAEERGLMQQEYIARILRVVQQEKEQLQENISSNSENKLDDLVEEMAQV